MLRSAPVACVAVLVAACGAAPAGPWFRGSFEGALDRARATERLVMLEFTTRWCSWCERLEADTLTDARVREALHGVVPLRLDAEGSGADLARRFGVDRYPTVVFVDGDGHEVDRILGYQPPEGFLERMERIQAGDTFIACLDKLRTDPADVDALRRSVEGFLRRSDPVGAMARIEAFHAADPDHGHELCRTLKFQAEAALLARTYDRAARLWRDGALDSLPAPSEEALPALAGRLEELRTLTGDRQAVVLRELRRADARRLVAGLDPSTTPPEVVRDAARFAFDNGSYGLAEKLYRSWYDRSGAAAAADALSEAARQLYLAGRDLELAGELAQKAWQVSPDPEAADTLRRILDRRGRTDRALALQHEMQALESRVEPRGSSPAVRTIRAGAEPADRPPFESWPGPRGTAL